MDAFLELFSFDGRVNRGWYFWHVVLDDFVILGTCVALALLADVVGDGLVLLPLVGVMIGGVWAAVAITVKRLHDMGRPGWHSLLFVIPLYNIWLGLVLVFRRGTTGANRYGPDPLRAARLPAHDPRRATAP